jgi:hypothetical protein
VPQLNCKWPWFGESAGLPLHNPSRRKVRRSRAAICFRSPLKEVTARAMPPIKINSVTNQQPMHPAAPQICPVRLCDQMKMVDLTRIRLQRAIYFCLRSGSFPRKHCRRLRSLGCCWSRSLRLALYVAGWCPVVLEIKRPFSFRISIKIQPHHDVSVCPVLDRPFKGVLA